MLMLGFPSFAFAAIYYWTDPQGVNHFSDTPSNKETLLFFLNDTHSPQYSVTSINHKELLPFARSPEYQLTITKPFPEETVWSHEGKIEINCQIKPSLQDNHCLRLLIDGIIYEKPQRNMHWIVKNLSRGAHQIEIQVLDKRDNVLIRTDPLTFYLQ